MSSGSQVCPRCGARKSVALAGNCPNCLIELGAPDQPLETISTQPPAALRSMGDYELIEEIARGGMGVVYRARQISLNRMVAVKVLLAGQFADEKFIHRFRREAEAAASLNHPHIVSIHDIGEHEMRPYFSMELINGRSLAEMVRETPLPARQAAQLLHTIAEAVQFAHDRGVLHRDLKPSNVLVDAAGVPHITDFGLAKKVETSGGAGASGQRDTLPADLTMTGQVLGSPNYMPPEQANPRSGPTTAASDVYSLGAILYHLLTGRPPHLADSMAQTLQLVVEADPVPPRLLHPALSRDLETICLKCLEKEPARRYASARELADELGRFLRDEPIRARAIGPVGRFWRWCRRKPALAASLGAGSFLLLVVVIGSPIAMLRIDAERQRAEKARQQEAGLRVRAETAEQETGRQLYTALLEQARATVRSGEIGHRVRALSAIRRAAAISNTVELRREMFAALALSDLEFERELEFPNSFTLRELDPTFERIALCQGPRAVEIWSVSNQQILTTLPAVTNRPAYVAEWSPNGQFLAIKRDLVGPGDRADLEVWDVTRQQRVLIRRDVRWGAMSFHPVKPWWMVGGVENEVLVFDLHSGSEIQRIDLPGRGVRSMQYSPDGGRFAVVHGGADRYWNVAVFDAVNGHRIAFRVFPLVMVSPVRWHPNGRWLVVPLGTGAVLWMDAATGGTGEIGAHKADATVAVFSPDGDYLLTTGWDLEIKCYDGHTRSRLFGIRENSFVAQFRADSGSCAIFTDSGVRLYKVARRSAHRDLAGDPGKRLRHAAFSADGRWLAASFEKCAAVWDLNGQGVAAVDEEGYEAHFFFSPDSCELFASRNNTRQSCGYRWRLHPSTNALEAPSLERMPLGTPVDFTFLTLHSNRVLITSERGSQFLSPENLANIPDQWMTTIPGVNSLSPDGKWLAIRRPFSGSAFIYGLPGFEHAAKLKHLAAIGGFVFSPVGDELLICSKGGLEFWSAASWQRTLRATNLVTHEAFYRPDGQALWLRRYRESGLYDRQTLQPKLLLSDDMIPLATSADGKLLAVRVEGRRLQVWNLEELRTIFGELKIDWTDR